MRYSRKSLHRRSSCLLGLMALMLVASIPAQQANIESLAATQGTSAGMADSTPQIVSVRSSRTDPYTVGLGDRLFVKVTNLHELMKHMPITLYLDGRLVPVEEPSLNLQSGEIEFWLMNSGAPDARKSWKALLGSLAFSRMVNVNVRPANGPPLAIKAKPVTINLVVVPQFWFWMWASLFAAGLMLLVMLARSTTLLRDAGPENNSGKRYKYSLAKAQMAFWLVLVLGGFVFIWLVLDETDAMTTSAVTLMGISGSTALGAVLVDSGKRKEASVKLQQLQRDQQMLQADTAVTVVPANDNPQPAEAQRTDLLQVRLQDLDNQIASCENQLEPRTSVDFLTDILSDANGISLHRVQIFVWTLVLGVTFVRHVYEYLEMPQFSGTLLALMGVSSGTYLGFKFPEKD